MFLMEKNNESLVLASPQKRTILFRQFNSLSNENDDDDDKLNNCKYYDLEEMQSTKIPKC